MEFKVEFNAAQIVAGHQEDGILMDTIAVYENHTAASLCEQALARRNKLESVNFPAVTRVGTYALYQCYALKSVRLPVAEFIGFGAFMYCEALERVRFPSVKNINGSAFRYCSSLTAFIIEQSDSVCSISAAAFSDTPIANGTGFVYVPDKLVDGYKKATNWSTYAAQIKPLSELSE